MPQKQRSPNSQLVAIKLSVLILAATIGLRMPAKAEGVDHVKEMVLSLPVVFRNGLIELRSDDPMLDASGIAAQMQDAYNFDRRAQGLESAAILDRPLIVGLATEGRIMEYMHTSMGGRAVGGTMFASHANFYRDRSDFAWFVTAHELEHLQMNRLRAVEPEVPVYIFEGIACSLGDRFVNQISSNSKYLINAKNKLASCTSDDAADIFKNLRVPSAIASYKSSGKLWQAEHLGGLFIEFLRNRARCGQNEFFNQCGSLWQDMGHGSSFLSGFEQHFGITLESAEQQFVDFMRETENRPDARFRNTIYQEVNAKE